MGLSFFANKVGIAMPTSPVARHKCEDGMWTRRARPVTGWEWWAGPYLPGGKRVHAPQGSRPTSPWLLRINLSACPETVPRRQAVAQEGGVDSTSTSNLFVAAALS